MSRLEVRAHAITLTSPYFSPEVMVKMTRKPKVREHFDTLIEVACILFVSVHISVDISNFQCYLN